MAAPKNSNGLTSRQEGFCQSYIELQSYTEAYIANYSTSGMKRKSVMEKASRMAAEVKIRSRIDLLTEQNGEKHEITIGFLTKQFLEVAFKAKDAGQYGAANGALTSLAKMHGHMIERGVIKYQHEMSVLAPDEINTAIGEIRELIAEKKTKTIDVNFVELLEAAE